MCRISTWVLQVPYVHTKRTTSYKAGVILMNSANQVLLVRNYSQKWSFPKGSVEYSEKTEQAAARELYEETGIQVQVQRLKIYLRYGKQVYYLHNGDGLEYDTTLIQNTSEITGIGWFCFEHLGAHDLSKPTSKLLERIRVSLHT